MEMLPVPPEEIAQVEQIVREAVGIDAGRGDSVSISSAQFQTFVPELPEAPGFMDSLSDFAGAGKMALGFIALMALIFGVLRPMLKSLGERQCRGGDCQRAAALCQSRRRSL